MCSPSFKSSESVRRTKRPLTRSPLISSPHQRSVRGDQPELVTDFWTPQAGLPQTVAPISRQREQTACWQFFFDQLFTWQTDQPRHATTTRGEPVESDRPRLAGTASMSIQAFRVKILSVPRCGSMRFSSTPHLEGGSEDTAALQQVRVFGRKRPAGARAALVRCRSPRMMGPRFCGFFASVFPWL